MLEKVLFWYFEELWAHSETWNCKWEREYASYFTISTSLSPLFFSLKLLANCSPSKNPAAAVQSQGRNCRWAAMLQHHRSCAALWNEKFTFGARQHSCFSRDFASEGSSLGGVVSQCLFHPSPRAACTWGSVAFGWKKQRFMMLVLLWESLYCGPKNWSGLSHFRCWVVTYLSDVFKGESSPLCLF